MQQLVPTRLGVRYHVPAYNRTLNPVFTTPLHWSARHLARPCAERGTLVRPPEGR